MPLGLENGINLLSFITLTCSQCVSSVDVAHLPVSCPGIFTGISRKFTCEYHRKHPSMWEIIHIHANLRGCFCTQFHQTHFFVGPLCSGLLFSFLSVFVCYLVIRPRVSPFTVQLVCLTSNDGSDSSHFICVTLLSPFVLLS